MPRIALLFCALFLVLATVAGAGTYTVTLENGTSFVTRYKPEDASWDDSMVTFATDRGNWIALAKDEIVEITSEVEESGFGYQVNTSTLFVGWSPNDLVPEEGEGGEGGAGGQTVNENLPDPNPPSFSVEQFVNPGQLVGSQPVRD